MCRAQIHRVALSPNVIKGQPDGGAGMNNIGAVGTTIENCGTSGRADYTAHYI